MKYMIENENSYGQNAFVGQGKCAILVNTIYSVFQVRTDKVRFRDRFLSCEFGLSPYIRGNIIIHCKFLTVNIEFLRSRVSKIRAESKIAA